MVMEMIGCLLPEFSFPDSIHGVCIPRKRRSSSSAEQSKPEDEAMLEAARILMAMANGGFCNDEIELNNRKRKKPPLALTKKQIRKKKRKEIELPSTPEMPAAMRDRIAEIGGYGIQLVIQKQLQNTDLNKNHGRLSLPTKKLRVDFATEEERKLLNEHEKKKKKGMEVVIMDPVLRERSIWLKKWKIGSSEPYCLMTNWNSLVEESALRSGDFIQLWCFRKNGFDSETQTIRARLCFAMVKLHDSQCD